MTYVATEIIELARAELEKLPPGEELREIEGAEGLFVARAGTPVPEGYIKLEETREDDPFVILLKK